MLYAAYRRTMADVRFQMANRRADSGVACARPAFDEYTFVLNAGFIMFCTPFSAATAPTSSSQRGSSPSGTASVEPRTQVHSVEGSGNGPISTMATDGASEDLPAFLPAPLQEPNDMKPWRLNGTQDMMELFGLVPLYDRAVRPYLRPDPAAAPGTTPSSDPGSAPAKTEGEQKRAVLPKTFVHYVEDLPGKVRPPKRTGAMRHQPKELTQLLMKPEYTYTPIVPFDADALNHAFSVEPSSAPAQGIDVSLLEADEQESPAPKKKKGALGDRPEPPKKRVVLISKKKRA